MASLISAGTATNTAVSITGDTTGALALATNNGVTAVTIDTSQNVGVGTATPAAKLDVRGSSTFLINATNPTAWVSVDSGLTTQSMYMQANTSSSDTRLGAYTNHPLLLLTNNTERVRISSTGLVGIGQSSPASMLDVFGSTNVTSGYSAGTSMPYMLRLFNSSSGVTGLTAGIQLQTRSGDQSGALWNIGAVAHSGGSYSNLVFQQQIASSFVEAARFDISGNFAIGTATPTTLLTLRKANTSAAYGSGAQMIDFKSYFPGYDTETVKSSIVSGVSAVASLNTQSGFFAIHVANAGTLGEKLRIEYTGNASLTGSLTQNASDERLKTNIQVIQNGLTKVCSLRGFTYNWNELAETLVGFDTSTNEVGVSAQEIQAVLPEAVCIAPFDQQYGDRFVSKSEENYLTVQYEKLSPLLIEAIKELKSIVDAQAVEIAALKAKVGS